MITPEQYRALALRKALQLYAKTRMQVNRDWTPTNMLATASRITGQTFKRGQYNQAADALATHLGLSL